MVAVVIGLVVLAAPLIPDALRWVTSSGPAASPSASAEAAADGDVTDCQALHPESLWAELERHPDLVLTPSYDMPATSATPLISALQPHVRLTCAWTSADIIVSSTVADVPPDAGAIAAASLPSLGYSCGDRDGRTLCTRESDEAAEEVEFGGEVMLFTVESGWRPPNYHAAMGEAVWEAAP